MDKLKTECDQGKPKLKHPWLLLNSLSTHVAHDTDDKKCTNLLAERNEKYGHPSLQKNVLIHLFKTSKCTGCEAFKNLQTKHRVGTKSWTEEQTRRQQSDPSVKSKTAG